MTQKNKERAETIGARTDVRRWVKRLEKLSRDMPPDVCVYVESGTPHVMAMNEDGTPCVKPDADESADPDAVVGRVESSGRWDGGGW